MENQTRLVLKSVSFRLIATLTTIVLVFAFTQEISFGLQVGFLEFFAKIVLFYYHERLWNTFQLEKK